MAHANGSTAAPQSLQDPGGHGALVMGAVLEE
jgi:hypothetical protein